MLGIPYAELRVDHDGFIISAHALGDVGMNDGLSHAGRLTEILGWEATSDLMHLCQMTGHAEGEATLVPLFPSAEPRRVRCSMWLAHDNSFIICHLSAPSSSPADAGQCR